jgi:membrane protease YdiL (CAAX protease family)
VIGQGFFPAVEPPKPIHRFFISAPLVLLAYLGTGIFLGAVFDAFHFFPDSLLYFFLNDSILLILLIAIYKLTCAALDDKPLAFVGIGLRGRWGVELGAGLVAGTVMILAVAALEGILGVSSFSWTLADGATSQHVLTWGIYIFVLFSIAGAAEELAFRGYPFQRLCDSLGAAGGIAVFSVVFGLAHLWNNAHTWLSTLNTMLVGVTLGVAYLRTRALWLPIGIHISWNFVEGFVLGYPVSGILVPAALVRPEVHGSAWLTGAFYGPEGSVLASVVILLGTLYLLLSKRIYVSKEMRELVFAPDPQASNSPQVPASTGADGRHPADFPGA